MNKAHTQHSALSTQHYTLWLMVILLLVAAALRLIGLNNVSPPGLEHDEVAHWLINRDILAGNHAIYFTDAYGHEAGITTSKRFSRCSWVTMPLPYVCHR